VVSDPLIYAEAKLFAESIQSGQVNVRHQRDDEKDSTDDEETPF